MASVFMYVYMCIYIYSCMLIYMYSCLHPRAYVYICIYTYYGIRILARGSRSTVEGLGLFSGCQEPHLVWSFVGLVEMA